MLYKPICNQLLNINDHSLLNRKELHLKKMKFEVNYSKSSTKFKLAINLHLLIMVTGSII